MSGFDSRPCLKARVAELVYAKDLKSLASNEACEFKSHPGHKRALRAQCVGASKLICLHVKFEDRSDMRRTIGEEHSEGQPTTEEAEADESCRQISPRAQKT